MEAGYRRSKRHASRSHRAQGTELDVPRRYAGRLVQGEGSKLVRARSVEVRRAVAHFERSRTSKIGASFPKLPAYERSTFPLALTSYTRYPDAFRPFGSVPNSSRGVGPFPTEV